VFGNPWTVRGSTEDSNIHSRDYLAYGRFTLSDDVAESFLDDAYFQVQVSKLVDEQWQ
jgi:hypothetical protein